MKELVLMVKEIIVIGAGLAGLTCSVKSASENMHVKLFSPAQSERSQSVMAMGGINAALNTKGEDDSVNEHYTDTINAGQHINNHDAVKKLTNDAPEIIDWLSKLGTSFTRDDNGNVDVRYFGGQKKMRTAYAGARTGKQILTAINTECRKWEYKDKIKRYVGWRFLSLILDDDKVCRGVVMINENTEEIRDFYADFVVIASGGMNKVFGKISGSLHNDGFVTGKLLEQGVELANMEMIQYHPTTIETPVKRMLITEAARGEGGRLYTLRNGEKWYFMEEWYPEQGALMPRDVVSRSIYRICHEYDLGIDGENKVYLDLTHLDEKTIRSIINEYGMHNADVLFRDDVTIDQFIDVLDRNKSYVPMLILLNKVDLVDEAYIEELKKYIPDFIPISADKKTNIEELKDLIFDNLDLVRVYLKPQGRKADMEDPLVIKKGSTVIDACGKLHREFVKNFRHAKVWGTSVKFPGQKVGPDHVLEDEDILRIILKK